MLTINKNFPGLMLLGDGYHLNKEIRSAFYFPDRVCDVVIDLDKPLWIDGLSASGDISCNVNLFVTKHGINSFDGDIRCSGKIFSQSVYAKGNVTASHLDVDGNIECNGSLRSHGAIIAGGKISAGGLIGEISIYGLKGIVAGKEGISSSGTVSSAEGNISSQGDISSQALVAWDIESLGKIHAEGPIYAGTFLHGRDIYSAGDIVVRKGDILSLGNIHSLGDLSVKGNIIAGGKTFDVDEEIPPGSNPLRDEDAAYSHPRGRDKILCRSLLSGNIVSGTLSEFPSEAKSHGAKSRKAGTPSFS